MINKIIKKIKIIKRIKEVKIRNLTTLGLSELDLKKFPKEIGSLKNLKVLNLGENQLTNLPKEIGNLKNLEWLNLEHNKLTELSKKIGNLKNLEELHLNDNQLTELPKEIGNLKNLEKLNLNNNQLIELPKEIGNLENLEELDSNSRQLFNPLRVMRKIKEVKEKNLVELDLSGFGLTELPKEIENLKNLKKLNLRCNKLTELSKEIKSLKRLEMLDLSRNKLTEFPKEIVNLKNLKELNLHNNQLTELSKKFGNLKNLTKLDLESNQLTEIPKEIGSLKNLQELDLRENQLTKIPKEIRDIENLEILGLDHIQSTKLPNAIKEFTEFNASCKEEINKILKIFNNSLDYKNFLSEIVKMNFEFDEENDIGAFFKSFNGFISVKVSEKNRIFSSVYAEIETEMGKCMIELVEAQGGGIGKVLYKSIFEDNSRENNEASVQFLESTDILLFTNLQASNYKNKFKFEKMCFEKGLSSQQKIYFMKKKSKLASHEYIVIKTGCYSKAQMSEITFGSKSNKMIFKKCFPQKNPDSDWNIICGEQVVGNYAPQGYEITDYTLFNKLVSEVENNYYSVENVL